MSSENANAMLARLEAKLSSMGSALVAFSGGVDSSLLAVAAGRALGPKALAVTALSPSLPARELESARKLAAEFGFSRVEIEAREMDCADYVANSPERCYFCKAELFKKLRALADERGFAFLLDGNNADDASDYRPGRRAAKEAGVVSPFMDLGFRKEDVRAMSRLLGLPTSERPAQACLASRLAYGVRIDAELLGKVEKAEDFLLALGLKNVRVRVHPGMLARIEVPEESLAFLVEPERRRKTCEALKALGFVHVSLDLKGYRTGSMNEALAKRP